MKLRHPLTFLAKPAVLLVFTAIAVLVLFMTRFAAFDAWWHLKAAELMLEDGRVPTEDMFSFTAEGNRWVYQSWLASLVLYGIYNLGDIPAMILARAAVLSAAFGMSWVAARRRGVSAGIASVVIIVCAFQTRWRALTRPHLFSFLMFMAFYLVLQHALTRPQRPEQESEPTVEPLSRSNKKWLLLLPALTVLWTNLHAGFLSGILLIGAFGAGEAVRLLQARGWPNVVKAFLKEPSGSRLRTLVVICLLCIAASVITPYGPHILFYPFRLLFGVETVRNINEWQPTPFETDFLIFWMVHGLYVLVFLRSILFAVGRNRFRTELPRITVDLLLAGGFGFLAIRSVRHLSWCMLLAAPVLGYHLWRVAAENQGEGQARKKAKVYAAVVFALGLSLVMTHVANKKAFGFAPRPGRAPVQACDWLEKNEIFGRPYHNYEWGGYLIWRLWPRQKVFIDGRCLVYGDEIIGQYLQVKAADEGWRSVLQQWDVDMLILRYQHDDWAHMFDSDRWRCVYWDDHSVVALTADALKRFEGRIEPLELTNPITFEDRLEEGYRDGMLKEIDRVLELGPECCTARVFRARCLLKLAESDGAKRDDYLRQARKNARRATRVDRESPEAWEVLGESLDALGLRAKADEAHRKAEELREQEE